MKYYYRVYGLNIQSSIMIPELEVIDNNCDVDVKLSYGVVNDEIKELIETGSVANYEKLDMWFHIKDVAIYHIYNGDTVVIEPYENASFKTIKLYILGSVLGLALLQKNMVAIHGGGIVINGKGCIFTGEKGAGKSTISTALRQKGHKFISDDVCSINIGEIKTINHGFAYQKICEDAMVKLGYNIEQFEQFRGDLNINKYLVPAFEQFTKEETPLEAIFELTVGEVDQVEIEELIGAKKMNIILENIFRVERLRYCGGINPIYFKKCLEIAKSIKLYKITRPKDAFSVDEQIRLIEEKIYVENHARLYEEIIT